MPTADAMVALSQWDDQAIAICRDMIMTMRPEEVAVLPEVIRELISDEDTVLREIVLLLAKMGLSLSIKSAFENGWPATVLVDHAPNTEE